jgi:hypothetical protein
LSTVYTSDLTGLNPSPVLAAVPALAQFTYLTVPVAAYVAAVGSDTAKAQAAAASSIAARVGRKPSPTAPAPAPAEAAGTTGVTVDVFFLVSGARGGSLSVYLNPASYSGPVEAATAAALAAANANTPTDVTPLVINLSTANRPTAVSVDPDLAHGYVFVALLDGRVLRMTLGPLLALKAAAALGLGPSPVVDVAAGPLPAWAVFITAAHATARQGYVYSLPYLPPTAATGNIQPPTTAPAAYLQPLPRPREWTQMRLVTIDTNRHLLDVFGDRGGPLQVDKVTGMPNPHTARSQVELPHHPHDILCAASSHRLVSSLLGFRLICTARASSGPGHCSAGSPRQLFRAPSSPASSLRAMPPTRDLSTPPPPPPSPQLPRAAGRRAPTSP